jgi:hypothetical protein
LAAPEHIIYPPLVLDEPEVMLLEGLDVELLLVEEDELPLVDVDELVLLVMSPEELEEAVLDELTPPLLVVEVLMPPVEVEP